MGQKRKPPVTNSESEPAAAIQGDYRSLFENSQAGIYRSKLDGSGYLAVNRKLADILDYSVEELMTRPPAKIWENAEDREEILRRVREDGTVSDFEAPVLNKNGERRILLASIKIFPDQGYLEGIAVDITKLKQAEQALQESEEKWRMVTDSLPDYLALLDLDYNIFYLNKTIRNLSPQDVIGKDAFDFITEKSKPVMLASFERVVQNGRPDICEVEYRDGDGRTRVLETRVAPFVRKGQITSLILSSSDITDRRRTESELRKFKTISDHAKYGSAISDLHGNLLYVNEAFAEMHSYRPDELIGRHLSVFHNEEQIAEVNRLTIGLIKNAGFIGEEVWHTRKDGTVFPTSMNATVVCDNAGRARFLSATAIDITERKRTEELLNQTTEQLKIEREALERKNIALREILGQIDKEKRALKSQIVTNIEEAIIPTLLRLKETAPELQKRNFELLERNLREITSPFLDTIKHQYPKLTPRECEICRLIKNGMTSKEIAHALKLAVPTVHKHRELIRKKLGLAGGKANLQTHLESIGFQ